MSGSVLAALSYDPLLRIHLGPIAVSPDGIMTAVGLLVALPSGRGGSSVSSSSCADASTTNLRHRRRGRQVSAPSRCRNV